MSNEHQTERRVLKEDKNLFITMILRQAGTLAKAGLEGIMNSVDSFFKLQQEGGQLPDRPLIEITLSTTHLRIVDNGRGFPTRDEILEIWEVFGTPHEEDKDGFAKDTRYGKFRMGRGQLFAFGKNTWRSRTCQMVTDIKEWAREYDLTSNMEDEPGCVVEVELYHTLSLREVQNCVDELTRMAKYVEYDVVINGTKVNTPPNTLKWDVETEDVYIKKRNSENRSSWGTGIEVYQQGVFVQNFPPSKFGLVGTVVTKEEVALNYARNEVMENCPRWKEIRKFLKQEGISDATRRKRLSKDQARNFVEEYSGGDGGIDYDTFFNTSCLPDVNGKLWSPKAVKALIGSRAKLPKVMRDPDGNILVDVAPKGDKVAEKVMQTRAGLVFDAGLVEFLRCEHHEGRKAQVEAMISTISGKDAGSVGGGDSYQGNYDRFNGRVIWADHTELLEDKANLDYHRLSPDEYTEREKQFLRCAGEALRFIDLKENDWSSMEGRNLCIGISALSDGWTDGDKFICINRDYISRLTLGIERDWHRMAQLLLELFCYKSDSVENATFRDTTDFLQDYLSLSDVLPDGARKAYQTFRAIVANKATKMPKQLRDQLNQEAETYVMEQLAFEPAPAAVEVPQSAQPADSLN